MYCCINNINILAFGHQHSLQVGQEVLFLTLSKEGFDFCNLLKLEFDFLTVLEDFYFCSAFFYVLSTSVCLSTNCTDYILYHGYLGQAVMMLTKMLTHCWTFYAYEFQNQLMIQNLRLICQHTQFSLVVSFFSLC